MFICTVFIDKVEEIIQRLVIFSYLTAKLENKIITRLQRKSFVKSCPAYLPITTIHFIQPLAVSEGFRGFLTFYRVELFHQFVSMLHERALSQLWFD